MLNQSSSAAQSHPRRAFTQFLETKDSAPIVVRMPVVIRYRNSNDGDGARQDYIYFRIKSAENTKKFRELFGDGASMVFRNGMIVFRPHENGHRIAENGIYTTSFDCVGILKLKTSEIGTIQSYSSEIVIRKGDDGYIASAELPGEMGVRAGNPDATGLAAFRLHGRKKPRAKGTRRRALPATPPETPRAAISTHSDAVVARLAKYVELNREKFIRYEDIAGPNALVPRLMSYGNFLYFKREEFAKAVGTEDFDSVVPRLCSMGVMKRDHGKFTTRAGLYRLAIRQPRFYTVLADKLFEAPTAEKPQAPRPEQLTEVVPKATERTTVNTGFSIFQSEKFLFIKSDDGKVRVQDLGTMNHWEASPFELRALELLQKGD